MTKHASGQSHLAASLKTTLGICVFISLAGCSRTHVSPYDMHYPPSAYASLLQNNIQSNMRLQNQRPYYAHYRSQTLPNNTMNTFNGRSNMHNSEMPPLRGTYAYPHTSLPMPAQQMDHMTYMSPMQNKMGNAQYGLYAPPPVAQAVPHYNTAPTMVPTHQSGGYEYTQAQPKSNECIMEVAPVQNTQAYNLMPKPDPLYCSSANTRPVTQPSVGAHYHDDVTGEVYLPEAAMH